MDTSLKRNMTRNLRTIDESSGLDLAYATMMKYQIRHLPVVNEDGEIVGILSDRDLQRAMISEVSGDGALRGETCRFDPENIVADYMSWPVKTADISTPLKSLTDKMLSERVSCYLITSEGSITGIITSDDLLKVLSGLLASPPSEAKLSLEGILLNPAIGRFAQTLSDSGI